MIKFIVIFSWGVCYTLIMWSSKRLMLGAPSLDEGLWRLFSQVLVTPLFYGIALLYVLSTILTLLSLKLLPLSVASPVLLALGAAVSILLGILVFGEKMTPLRILGLTMTLAGVFVTMYEPRA
jgi:multidrug transporter EmrE-like cation transporter